MATPLTPQPLTEEEQTANRYHETQLAHAQALHEQEIKHLHDYAAEKERILETQHIRNIERQKKEQEQKIGHIRDLHKRQQDQADFLRINRPLQSDPWSAATGAGPGRSDIARGALGPPPPSDARPKGPRAFPPLEL